MGFSSEKEKDKGHALALKNLVSNQGILPIP
jgi:hypothetical protein